jgi:hypothetical protein
MSSGYGLMALDNEGGRILLGNRTRIQGSTFSVASWNKKNATLKGEFPAISCVNVG